MPALATIPSPPEVGESVRGMLNGRVALAYPKTTDLRSGLPCAAGIAALVGIGLLLAALPLEIATAAVLVVGVIVLAFLEPLVALAALLIVLPLSTLATLEAGDFSVTAIEPLMVLL